MPCLARCYVGRRRAQVFGFPGAAHCGNGHPWKARGLPWVCFRSPFLLLGFRPLRGRKRPQTGPRGRAYVSDVSVFARSRKPQGGRLSGCVACPRPPAEPVSVPTWGGILPPAEEKERLTLPQWRGVWSRYRQLPASGVPLWPVRGAQGLRLHWCSAGSGHNTAEMSHCPRSSAHRGPMVAKAFVELPGSHDRVPSASCFLTGLRRGGSVFPVCGPAVVSLGIYLSPQDTLAERWPRQREM